jgi:tetrapyrrole methylase family protein/MazG family protein
MPRVTVVGIGPGPLSWLTIEAERELQLANKIFFRTNDHPAFQWLRELGKQVISFDVLYTQPWSDPREKYKFMAEVLLKEANIRGHAIYAVPGSPFVFEHTIRLLQQQSTTSHVETGIIHGMSFLEPGLSTIRPPDDPGLQIVLPYHLRRNRFNAHLPLLVCQIEAGYSQLVMELLLRTYPPTHAATLIWTEGLPDHQTLSKIIELRDLNRECGPGKLWASLYVPSVERKNRTQLLKKIYNRLHRKENM